MRENFFYTLESLKWTAIHQNTGTPTPPDPKAPGALQEQDTSPERPRYREQSNDGQDNREDRLQVVSKLDTDPVKESNYLGSPRGTD